MRVNSLLYAVLLLVFCFSQQIILVVVSSRFSKHLVFFVVTSTFCARLLPIGRDSREVRRNVRQRRL